MLCTVDDRTVCQTGLLLLSVSLAADINQTTPPISLAFYQIVKPNNWNRLAQFGVEFYVATVVNFSHLKAFSVRFDCDHLFGDLLPQAVFHVAFVMTLAGIKHHLAV